MQNQLKKRKDFLLVIYIKELFAFGYKQALSCIFPVFIFICLAVSHLIPVMPRYDFLLLACILMQFMMYQSGMETKDEVLVITFFHLLGLIMELHKVHAGSWSYPETAWTKFFGVPLYSGFMYASVGSYVCQAWRRFDLHVKNWPSAWPVVLCGTAIYGNFITNYWLPDIRWYLVLVLLLVFRKTMVSFYTNGPVRHMPMLVAFILIGFFVWLAENIATWLGAWQYAYQHAGWQMVDFHKLSSWSLLIIVSVMIIAQLKKFKYKNLE